LLKKPAFIVVLMPIFGFVSGCKAEECKSAGNVRIKIQNNLYELPASYQPYITSGNKEFPTRDKIQDGQLIHQYCQRSDEVPFNADAIILNRRALNRIAAEKSEYSRLRGLDLVSIERGSTIQPPTVSSGSLTNGGLFRRVEKKNIFELFSTKPLLFGSGVSAFCGPAPTREPGSWCTIWGEVAPGIRVTVKLTDAIHPIDEWSSTLEDVERLIKSFSKS